MENEIWIYNYFNLIELICLIFIKKKNSIFINLNKILVNEASHLRLLSLYGEQQLFTELVEKVLSYPQMALGWNVDWAKFCSSIFNPGVYVYPLHLVK